jgi:hypothetical protein
VRLHSFFASLRRDDAYGGKQDEENLTMPSNELVPVTAEILEPLFQRAISNVRDDMADSPYIAEALRVLPVQGYRSAIGCLLTA